MSTVYDIIKRPIVTEKTSLNQDLNQVTFEVSLESNKHQIRGAIETLFDVKVLSVNTAVMQGKRKRFGRHFGKRSNWKKAYVKLAEGHQIPLYEA